MRLSRAFATIVASLSSYALAGDFSYSCYNYYLNNGISDGSGELFIEAFCSGGTEDVRTEGGTSKTGARPPVCSRLDIQDCYKNANGVLEAYTPDEQPNSNLITTCDIESCAMMGDAWDGPILTCFCQDDNGWWTSTSVNLNGEIGNNGGFLQCGSRRGILVWKQLPGGEL